MGQLALYDALQGKLSNEDFDLFSFDDIDAVFDRVEQLKYNQTVSLCDYCILLKLYAIL